jgi:hypothetical protein
VGRQSDPNKHSILWATDPSELVHIVCSARQHNNPVFREKYNAVIHTHDVGGAIQFGITDKEALLFNLSSYFAAITEEFY